MMQSFFRLHSLTKRHVIRSLQHDSGGMTQPMSALVTCLPGLETVLSNEMATLRIPHEKVSHGAKLHRPSLRAIYQCNLLLGSASNILLPIGQPFSARGLPELRRKIAKLPWLQVLANPHIRLQVRVTTAKSKLQHSTAIQARVVAGIYEALGYEIPSDQFTLEYPPSITDEDPLVRLEVQLLRDQVQIWLCAATTPLHRRGYRLETGKAPLREDLAYAMLYGAGWRPSWSSQIPRLYEKLLDPLCGSGTIAIEGAAIALGLAPGRLRPPPLVGTKYEDTTLHQELLLEGSSATSIGADSPIVFASDRDIGAIKATKSNADRAGVTDIMQIQTCALSDHPLWSRQDSKTKITPSLLVACNPPFGRRVSKTKGTDDNDGITSLLPLYQTLNKVVTNSPNTSAALLVKGTHLVRRAGWKGDELFQSTHGGLSVTVIHYKSKKNHMK